jgi:putative drug exporter of the RND superfamily
LTPLLYRLGHFCARHPVSVLVVWLAVALAIVCVARTVGQETNDNLSLPGTDSQAASNLLGDKFPDQANGSVPIAFRAPSGARLSDTKYKKPIERVTKAYSKDPAITQAVGPFGEEGGDQLNKKHTIGYISLNLKDSPSELSIEADDPLRLLDRPLEKAGLDPAAGGYLGQKVSKPSTHVSEVVGLTAAVFILLFTFGTAIAMGIPILTAILGLSAGLGIIALISHTVEVPTSAPTLATMIGLGVGIDYALFIVTRHRSQLAEGMEPRESVARATATAGGAVVFAGGTVIIALLSLAAAGIPLVTTLGYTAAIVVVVAASAATTLLPAILGLIGLSINRLRVPGMRQHHDQRPHGWARWAAYVGSHPWPALIVGLVVLLIFAAPVRSLHLGQTDNGALPKDTQSRQSYDKMSEGFGPGSNGPMLIAVNLSKPAHNDQADLDKLRNQQQAKQKEAQEDKAIEKQVQEEAAKKEQSSGQEDKEMFLESKSSDPRLTALRTDLQKTKGVDTVTLPLVNKKGDAAVYTVTATTAPSSRATEDLVNILRNDVIPKATKGKQMSADVGGTTASYIDLASEISSKLPLVIGIVLVLSFFLLLLAFRSLLVPLKAVVMNVFSILAAFGVVTYAFNHDWTARLIGLEGAIPIVSFVPLMMFAILFGLSMDYEVFLMTHVREQWKETNDPHEAVVHGLASTARVITSAAMIMVSVFLAFVINGDPTVKQFGLGMAVAVAVDATVVRCVLVPAIMSLLGSSGWWLPKWMERASPKFSIEGNEWFAKHEIPAEQANTLPEKPEEHHEPDRTE